VAVLVVTSSRFADHLTPPGHPERSERAEVMEGVALEWRDRGGAVAGPRAATRDELARVHDTAHLDAVAGTAGRALALDPDTYTSPDSHEVALLAAGASIVAAEHAIDGKGPALAMVRPPGHHAERERAMGFCLYNNVAAAAAHARARGVARVAIVDIDVHHGNGTQWIFYDDPSVLYVSLHQYPFYPGTGAADEVGTGAGRGFTVNVPLEAGATDLDYQLVCDMLVGRVLDAFSPELLLVSAGYDAHERDPLGGMRLTTAGYADLMCRLRWVAETCCEGRIAVVTEGGYDLEALAGCLHATLRVLENRPSAPGPSEFRRVVVDRAGRSIEQVRAAQRPFWPAL
jgi:acetoin utilization deacetylase AcuC-like enzyme